VEVLNLGKNKYVEIVYEWKVSPVEECDRQNHMSSRQQ